MRVFVRFVLLVWLFFLILCFFFKQKTAYEMRISDWSSDVCSSDLGVQALDRVHESEGAQAPLRRAGAAPGVRASSLPGAEGSPEHAVPDGREIGRASRRERVCQYV